VSLALAHAKLANQPLNALVAQPMDFLLILKEFVSLPVVMDLFWEARLAILD
jgi:hypothetical protein